MLVCQAHENNRHSKANRSQISGSIPTLRLTSGAGRLLQTFATIRSEDDDAYKELLRLSRDVSDMFNPREESLKDLVQSMYPLGTPQPGHWNSFYQATVDATVTNQSEDDQVSDLSDYDEMTDLSEDEMDTD